MLFIVLKFFDKKLLTPWYFHTAPVSQGQNINSNYISYYEKTTYNCTIPRILQGEWYSRETNLDTVTIIDASRMQRRGICMEQVTDFGGNFTFLFAENPEEPATCFHCVRLYARTVNIVEKIESEFNFWFWKLFKTYYVFQYYIMLYSIKVSKQKRSLIW